MLSTQGGARGVATRGAIILTLAVLWISGVVFSARYLLRYEKTPGRTASAPLNWPADVAETGDAGLPTLVVALHPRCFCSRASLIELETAAESFKTPFNALLLIYQAANGQTANGQTANGQTANGGRDWQNDELYRNVQRHLHARVLLDADGALAARFGAQTSGEVILYSAADGSARRNLLYAGGVTGARGMNGENRGAEALVRAFQEQRNQAGSPVYGCGLFSLGSEAKSSVLATGLAGSRGRSD